MGESSCYCSSHHHHHHNYCHHHHDHYHHFHCPHHPSHPPSPRPLPPSLRPLHHPRPPVLPPAARDRDHDRSGSSLPPPRLVPHGQDRHARHHLRSALLQCALGSQEARQRCVHGCVRVGSVLRPAHRAARRICNRSL